MKNGRYSLKERLLAILVSFFMLFQMTPEIALAADGDGTSLPTGTDTASGDDGWEETLSNVRAGETYYTVSFIEDGQQLTQLIVENGVLSVMPQNPFREGSRFKEWNTEADGSGETVEAGRTITGDLNVYAIFETMTVYQVEAKYWYTSHTEEGGRFYFDTQVFQFEADEVPYIINCPVNINQQSSHTGDTQNPIYYPSQPTIEITADDLENATQSGNLMILPARDVQYVPYTATYAFVYMLKNIDGNGYTEIEREANVKGVLGSTVTATIKEYDNYTFEHTEPKYINAASGIEIPVYYTRNTMTLTYNSTGGSYVAPQTGVYGSQVSVTSTTPTRTGYTFQGWYDAEEGGNRVTGNVTLNANKTLNQYQ